MRKDDELQERSDVISSVKEKQMEREVPNFIKAKSNNIKIDTAINQTPTLRRYNLISKIEKTSPNDNAKGVGVTPKSSNDLIPCPDVKKRIMVLRNSRDVSGDNHIGKGNISSRISPKDQTSVSSKSINLSRISPRDQPNSVDLAINFEANPDKKNSSELENKIRQLEKDLLEKTKENNDLKKEKIMETNYAEELKNFRTIVADLHNKSDKQEKEIEVLNLLLNDAKVEKTKVESELVHVTTELKEMKFKNAKEKELGNIENEVKLAKERNHLNSLIEEKTDQLESLQERFMEMNDFLTELDQLNKELTVALETKVESIVYISDDSELSSFIETMTKKVEMYKNEAERLARQECNTCLHRLIASPESKEETIRQTSDKSREFTLETEIKSSIDKNCELKKTLAFLEDENGELKKENQTLSDQIEIFIKKLHFEMQRNLGYRENETLQLKTIKRDFIKYIEEIRNDFEKILAIEKKSKKSLELRVVNLQYKDQSDQYIQTDE